MVKLLHASVLISTMKANVYRKKPVSQANGKYDLFLLLAGNSTQFPASWTSQFWYVDFPNLISSLILSYWGNPVGNLTRFSLCLRTAPNFQPQTSLGVVWYLRYQISYIFLYQDLKFDADIRNNF